MKTSVVVEFLTPQIPDEDKGHEVLMVGNESTGEVVGIYQYPVDYDGIICDIEDHLEEKSEDRKNLLFGVFVAHDTNNRFVKGHIHVDGADSHKFSLQLTWLK